MINVCDIQFLSNTFWVIVADDDVDNDKNVYRITDRNKMEKFKNLNVDYARINLCKMIQIQKHLI